MTTGCYETSLLLFANARGAETLLTVKCPSPGTHRETNARGLPGGTPRDWSDAVLTFSSFFRTPLDETNPLFGNIRK